MTYAEIKLLVKNQEFLNSDRSYPAFDQNKDFLNSLLSRDRFTSPMGIRMSLSEEIKKYFDQKKIGVEDIELISSDTTGVLASYFLSYYQFDKDFIHKLASFIYLQK